MNNHICEMLALPKSEFELAREARYEAEKQQLDREARLLELARAPPPLGEKQDEVAAAEKAAEAGGSELPAFPDGLDPTTGVRRLQQLLDSPAKSPAVPS